MSRPKSIPIPGAPTLRVRTEVNEDGEPYAVASFTIEGKTVVLATLNLSTVGEAGPEYQAWVDAISAIHASWIGKALGLEVVTKRRFPRD